MSVFSLFYRNKLQSVVPAVVKNALIDELDNLVSSLSTWALVEHNEDGTHNTRSAGIDFVPVGGMIQWPLTTAPTGWLLCNGAAVSRTEYPLLFAAIGIISGSGNGTTTFNVPNVANFIILAI